MKNLTHYEGTEPSVSLYHSYTWNPVQLKSTWDKIQGGQEYYAHKKSCYLCKAISAIEILFLFWYLHWKSRHKCSHKILFSRWIHNEAPSDLPDGVMGGFVLRDGMILDFFWRDGVIKIYAWCVIGQKFEAWYVIWVIPRDFRVMNKFWWFSWTLACTRRPDHSFLLRRD